VDERRVSATRVIPAPADAIFALLADPARHPELDGSSMVQRPTGSEPPTRLAKGSRFGMAMKLGPIPYRMSNQVIEFEEGRRIAWRHLGRHVWRWELEPVEGGTKVTETWDWAPMGPAGKVLEALKVPARNQAAMERSLDRLAGLVGR
jgi:uncharacterized protein YndB with AHSA1/START domain